MSFPLGGAARNSKGAKGAAARRHDRSRFAATVQLMLAGGQIVEGRTMDISEGGMLLLLPLNLPVDTTCRLRLLVPASPSGAREVTAEAQVASIVLSGREGGFLAGLRFTQLPPASRAGLEDYLRMRQDPIGRRRR
ncbi:PilZ domain-containing protein [Azohydromonas lata]|uniref:PilZ domain-containing protein n=1 Tax=Azohydromonas lata TaxID=45677 RepID=A0ABU5ILM3_9BURK|nr:PilZ domain-containing protein [Azohydromonas lata]MDZ5459808.1 PilZ domain-containing protein [Azohydromonas lata]